MVTLVWIDLELTGAASSWLDNGGEGVAFRIWVGPFLALSLWGLIDGGLRSGEWFWGFGAGERVKAAPGGVKKISVQVAGFLPVLFRCRNAFSGDWDPLTALWSDECLSIFLLCFQFYVFDYGFCLRLINYSWIVCYFHAVAIDQLLWFWADGDNPAVVLLMGSGGGSAGRRGFGFPRLSLLLSAICIIYYYFVVVVMCRYFMFPTSPCPRGLRINGFSLGCYTLHVRSAIAR